MDVGGKEAAASGATRSADPIAWMVDSLKDYAIFTLDAAGRVTSWNTGAERIIGYPAAAILGQPAARLYTGEDVAGALPQRQLEQAAAADHIESEEWHVRQDGSRFWAHVTTTALRDSAGRLGGFGTIMRDFTLEERARQSQKMEAIGQLAGGVAHDFNNLLTIITGYSQLILNNLSTHDPNHNSAEQIMKAADRAATLTKQLLAFSRRQVLQPRVLDINKLIGGLGTMLRRLIGEDVDLQLVLRPELGQVSADPGQVEQVMLADLPIIPVVQAVDWYQYDDSSLTGWPTPGNPYAQPAAYAYPDMEQVLLHLQPK